MSITLLDGILLAVMLISALLAMIRGFSREVLSIVSWLVAAFAALALYAWLAPLVTQTIPDIASNPLVANVIAAAIIFLVVLILASYITMRMADFIIDSRIGALDRTLGFIFGAIRGALLVIVTLMGFLWLAGDKVPPWIANARSYDLLVNTGQGILEALPENLEEEIMKRVRPEPAETPATGEPAGEAERT